MSTIKFLVPRIVADDLCNYWQEVDAADDASEFSKENADCIGAVRSALRVLSEATWSNTALIAVDFDSAAAEEFINEAKNRRDIARDWVKETSYTHEGTKAKALYSAYQRVLKQVRS